jgi:hypothetical protein
MPQISSKILTIIQLMTQGLNVENHKVKNQKVENPKVENHMLVRANKLHQIIIKIFNNYNF